MKFKSYDLFFQILKENHVLIAGATGSGKSVLLNNLIYTSLLQGDQLILIDPKKVELSPYSQTENCILYADEKAEMISALEYAISIIERRYAEMKRRGLRLYDGRKVTVVVDELADLMLTCKREAQPLLQRIAQIGRASKVSLIAATQVPLREVIPTTIKANFDCRIGLRTACAQDSRNIIGVSGCEMLPNPKLTHKAEAYVRSGADIGLFAIPMIPQEDIDKLIELRTPKKKSIFEALFGKKGA